MTNTERKLFVLDTNILMHDPTAIYHFQEHDIYIPMVVLEELDRHKTGLSEVARNAEQNFALNRLLDPNIDFITLQGQAGNSAHINLTRGERSRLAYYAAENL